jgi:molybdate transport system substrate-binding protein
MLSMKPIRSEITLLCPPSLRSSLQELAPGFEQATGHCVVIDWQLMPPMKANIDAGAMFDLAILTPSLMQDAISRGAIRPSSEAAFARTGLGLAIRRGSAHPDISTIAAVTQTLRAASSIGYTGEGAAGLTFLSLLDRLGIRGDISAKLRAMPGGGAVGPVARGEVDIAITTIPGIFEVPGAELVGTLPDALQSWVVYVAGAGATSRDAAACAAFISFLTSPAAQAIFASKGLLPAGLNA